MERKVVIGSRGSQLALWQSNYIIEKLEALGIQTELKIIKTEGDIKKDLSFDKMEGKGFFTKEIEQALLSEEVDLAVHSHKDLETTPPTGLKVAAVSDRADPSELLLINKAVVNPGKDLCLQKNAIVGTSSSRRKSQLLALREDVQVKDLRGNVPTRIKKLREGNYDAIILARAGVQRLGLNIDDLHVEQLDPRIFIPAPAQGVLAFQIREDDEELEDILKKINDPEVGKTTNVERKALNLLNGGCQLPFGIYCRKDEEGFNVWASLAEKWDSYPKRIHLRAMAPDGLSAIITKKLQAKEKKTVLITKQIEPKRYLFRSLKHNGYKVTGISLIETEQITTKNIPNADWIFFSSPKAVVHFFGQNPSVPEKTKLAVLGSGTGRELKKTGHLPDFTGTKNIADTAKEFAELAKGKKILFPCAEGSLRTVQKEVEKSAEVIDLVVYRTKQVDVQKIPEADIIVFTSPSNVRSFFEQDEIKPDQKVIAMGKTTGKALKSRGIAKFHTPYLPDEPGLLDVIYAL